jgi:hypothetical protein
MEIRSIFGGITSWNQLEPGVLFYVPIKEGTRLGMKVEQSGEYRNSPLYSCLLFDSASRLESSNRCQQATLVELKDAAFISTKIAAFSDPPLVGQIIQVREHGPLLNVLDQNGNPVAVQLGTGKVLGKWPTQPEALFSTPEWKIVLAAPLATDRWHTIWPLD